MFVLTVANGASALLTLSWSPSGNWRSLSPEQQGAEDEARRWSLSNWLYWFDRDGMGNDRGWASWDCGASDSSTGWIEVETAGYPYPSGALRW